MASYDPGNIFAKILRGELPSYKVYEDDKAFVMLDIMPRAPGHALVMPKSAARNILDVAPDDLAHVMQVVQKVAKAGMTAFGAKGVTIQQFNEVAGGLNQMTVRKFVNLVAASDFDIEQFRAVPIARLRRLSNPLTRELFTSTVRCRLVPRPAAAVAAA